jgi:septum formation protein
MFFACLPLVLASASPRRQDFLARLGLQFQVAPADIDETLLPGESPEPFARRMAAAKAELVARDRLDACVIGADTVVALDGTVFGKPRDPDDALAILQALRGRTHQVITGVAVVCPDRGIGEVFTVTSQVSFAAFPDEILRAYIATGEPTDKAGAYAIQGRGAFLVHAIAGSCSNVIGLPVHDLVSVLLHHRLVRAAPAEQRQASDHPLP